MLVFPARSCTSITKGKRPWACFWVQEEVAAWGVAASRGGRGQPRAGLPVEVVTLRARQSGDRRAQPTVPKGSPLRKEHLPKAKTSDIGPPLETGPVLLTTEADRAGKRKKKAKHSRTQKDPEGPRSPDARRLLHTLSCSGPASRSSLAPAPLEGRPFLPAAHHCLFISETGSCRESSRLPSQSNGAPVK